jgi:hypothetical protein
MKDMKSDKDNRTNSENSLDSFDVMEEAIDLSIQQEYDSFSAAIDINNVDYKEVLKESKHLFLGNMPIETKKRILILLAHFGNAESYRTIEKYLKESEENLRDWALLSLKECRMLLESDLLEVEGGIISAGLGGKGNKLRYYFLVSSKGNLIFSETRRNTLKRQFETISQKYNSEIEEIKFEPNYAMLRTLIPMDFAAGEVIEEGIRECNKVDDFLYFHYYITNVRKPTNEEIFKYLEEIRQGGK